MPWTCFDYQPGVPPGIKTRNAAQSALPDLRRMPHACFSYPASCFNYPGDVPPDIRDRDAAQPAVPGLRRMPNTCFRY